MSEITISNRAAARIAEILKEESLPANSAVRISVVSGGCSGLTYDLRFDPENKAGETDQVLSSNGIEMIVDRRSFLYLAGTELDYSDGLQGMGFHFQNPNAVRTCSCGESFSL
ncbi:MAG: iron-sulfur cluster assembly accessory protein [Balneolaceae bacterium]